MKCDGIGLSVSPWIGNALMLVFPRRGPAARRVDELSRKGAKTVTVKEVLLSRKADVFLSYTSNAGNYPAESFRTLQIPTDENVDARYGMLLMTSRAAPLSRWLESQEALRLMAEAGFRA